MKIMLASPRGFCAGVNMAIECLEEAVRRFGSGIYVYHEIVHNRYVVDRFCREGVTFVDDVADVPEGSILLFSAHGVSPEIREAARQRRLHAIDATCPLVTKVHLEAVRFAKQGCHILLVGHEGHDEVIGTMGEVPASITLVQSPEEVDQLSFRPDDKLAWLTQTTLSVDEAGAVIDALKHRYPQIEGPPKDDICYATTNRQEVVKELAERADALIVLGSQNSSNSRRLMEIGEACDIPAWLVDGPEALREDWFSGDETVLITAGASAPEVVVQDCIGFLVDRFDAEVLEESIREEMVKFPLPKELRVLEH